MRLVAALLLALLASLGAGAARAQGEPPAELPAGTLRIFVPFAAGGPTDMVMRILGDILSPRIGRTVVIENRPGAGTIVATAALEARRRTPPLNFTSSGPRGAGHMTGELLKRIGGFDMTHVPYNGGAPALTDLVAGRVPIMSDIWHSARSHVEAGNLKAIAVAGGTRLAVIPNVPTIAETYAGFSAVAFQALIAPAELDAFLRAEIERWREVAAAANIKID